MRDISYIEPSGARFTIDVPEGWGLMQGATADQAEGIEGEHGGSCACSTCHCHIDDAGPAKLPAPADNELAMVGNTAVVRRPNSRLACRLTFSAALAGLVLRSPETQS